MHLILGKPRLGARLSESWRALPEGTNTEDSGSAGGFVGETWRRPIGIEEEMLMYDSWRSTEANERKPFGPVLEPTLSTQPAREDEFIDIKKEQPVGRECWKKKDKSLDPRKDIEPVEEEFQAPSVWDL
ncbi:unnamed protein product [Toxocara canis]|uniref:Uncharacterized protein n=1 Tax=Toxocara canis TaxID=6265 RepID=A0A3P7F2Y6_TOXCA|nr:unnamed protein product [Toxocara canis]